MGQRGGRCRCRGEPGRGIHRRQALVRGTEDAHSRQPRACDPQPRGRHPRLQMHICDARQDVGGKDQSAASFRSTRGHLPDRGRARGSSQLLQRIAPPGGRNTGRGSRQPVLQSREPRSALPLYRSRDLGPDRRRTGCFLRRHGNGRHTFGVRQILQGKKARDQDHRRRPGRFSLL